MSWDCFLLGLLRGDPYLPCAAPPAPPPCAAPLRRPPAPPPCAAPCDHFCMEAPAMCVRGWAEEGENPVLEAFLCPPTIRARF
ncbi:MAG: hypothetical protein K0R39_1575 [Symbiobacteriaceae bacterium]|jgi:hypothetical protein|nr:hypothetical protein [Symbiobacteriaceae bacterium]